MSNSLIAMMREILAIEFDLLYRFDCTNENPTVDDFELYTFIQTLYISAQNLPTLFLIVML